MDQDKNNARSEEVNKLKSLSIAAAKVQATILSLQKQVKDCGYDSDEYSIHSRLSIILVEMSMLIVALEEAQAIMKLLPGYQESQDKK